MNIFLMRHGEALSLSEWGRDDESRPLSSLGEALLTGALNDMRRLGFSASRLLTSPFFRARQTAEIIEDAFPPLKATVVSDLSAGSSLAALKSVVEKFKSEASLWMVGHMPDLAVLGSRLTSEAYLLEKGLRPGEIWAIDIDFNTGSWGSGQLRWSRQLQDWAKLKAL